MSTYVSDRVGVPSHDWDGSAAQYAEFALTKNLYWESAEALVRLARIEPGMVILDLACGSGVVTETVLKHVGDDVRIIAVDYSQEMLARAQSRINSRRVNFHQGQAENLATLVSGKVDRVLCNAAFWHFDKSEALAQISRILSPSGKCLISLPVQDFKSLEMSRLYTDNKVIWMIIEEKSLRGYPSARRADTTERRDHAAEKAEIMAHLPAHDLTIERTETIAINVTAQDYIDFLRIPIMAKKSFLFKGVPDDEILEILDIVEHQLAWTDAVAPPNVWNISILVKRHPTA